MLQELGQYSLQSLRVFAHVASLGSVADAAVALGLTQPAVSLQIHSLEDQLKFSLFERKGRRNVLTPQGLAFLQRLLPQLEKLESLILDAKDSEQVVKPELNIGAIQGIGEFWLSKRVHEFSAEREGLRLDLNLAETAVLEQKLLRGELSLIITARRFEHPRVISQVLLDERFVPVGRKKLIRKLSESLENREENRRPWESVDWIAYGEPMNVDHWALRWMEQADLVLDRRFKYRHHANSYPIIKQLLLESMGVSVIPLHTCEAELESGHLVSLESKKFPALKNKVYLSWREDSLNSIHQQFQNWLLKIAKPRREA